MKHILLSIFLLLSGSVWGQGYDTNITPEMGVSIVDSPSVLYSDSVFPIYQYFYSDSQLILTVAQVKEIVRAEIEKWWEEENKPDSSIDWAWFISYIDTVDVWRKQDTITIPEPLKMIIDTVRVEYDTTGFNKVQKLKHRDDVWMFGQCNDYVVATFPGQYKSCDLPSHMDTIFVWTPIVDTTYTLDTLYDLTPEQVEKLR